MENEFLSFLLCFFVLMPFIGIIAILGTISRLRFAKKLWLGFISGKSHSLSKEPLSGQIRRIAIIELFIVSGVIIVIVLSLGNIIYFPPSWTAMGLLVLITMGIIYGIRLYNIITRETLK